MFNDSQTMTVTFRLDAAAEQAYLCLQPCDGSLPGARGAWVTRPLRQVATGRWESVECLPPGWWRFRYYTEERGTCFYAEPTQSVLHMDGLDAMIHVSRVAFETSRGGLLAQALAAALAPVVPAALFAQPRPRRLADTDVRNGFVAATPEHVDQHIRALAGTGDAAAFGPARDLSATTRWYSASPA